MDVVPSIFRKLPHGCEAVQHEPLRDLGRTLSQETSDITFSSRTVNALTTARKDHVAGQKFTVFHGSRYGEQSWTRFLVLQSALPPSV